MNMIHVVLEPQSSAEMLSNSHRLPIEVSSVYEPRSFAFIIVKNKTDQIYDRTKITVAIHLSESRASPKIKTLSTAPINVCRFYSIRE